MSFGFGVGDFLAVIELANKIQKRFADAPTKVRDISYEVESLSILLSDVSLHADTVAAKLDPSKAEQLKKMRNVSDRVLQDLEKLLIKYDTLNRAHGSTERRGAKQIWARLNFDSGEVVELRQRLMSTITMLKFFLDNHTTQNTQKSVGRLENQIDEQERGQVLDWISKECEWHTDRQKWLIGGHEPGTRKWLFDSPEWQTWARDQGRGTTLFCPGIPGAGKTHASAMVIERLHDMLLTHEVGVAFAFCDYQRSDEREHVDLARNLLRMLLEHLQAWPAAVRQIYDSSQRSRSEISLDEIFDLLKTSLQLRKRNFVVIDALDELDRDAREVLIPKLFELQQCAGLNLFFTSRDIAQIGDLFSGTPQSRIKATEEDIERYISTHMVTLPSFVSKDTKLQDEIKEAVVQAAGEMFLLADLHLRSLKTKSSRKTLRKALQSFSSGPDLTKEALDTAMQRVTSQPEEAANTALKALMILTTARRPLTVDELCHALAIDLEDLEDGFDEENIPPIDYVLTSCTGLVIVEAQPRHARLSGAGSAPSTTPSTAHSTTPSTTLQGVERPSGNRLVQVAHKSIRDYLSSPQSGWFSHAEARMAAICRVYKQAFDKPNTKQGDPSHFLDYIQNHWGYHLINCDQEVSEASIKRDAVMQIARQGSFPLAAKQDNDRFGLQQLALELEGMRDSVLMWACYENKMSVIDILLSNNIDWYQKPITGFIYELGSLNGCGLAWCSVHGGAEDVYPYGVSPPETNDFSLDVCTEVISDKRIISAALVAAASHGKVSIAETLMGYGASIAGRDESGLTALGAAALNGQSEMLGWLLGLDTMDAKYHLEIQPRFVMTQAPVRFGQKTDEASNRLVLNVGVGRDGHKCTLYAPRTLRHITPRSQGFVAIGRRRTREKMVGRVAMTPLAAAVFNGHEICVNLLVDWMQKHYHEAPAAEWKASCMNAMLCAMQRGHLSIMRILLPFVDVHSPAPNFNGYSLLHFAILMKDPEAVRLILTDQTVDLSQADIGGRTALAFAARMGADDLVQELWDRGAAHVDPLAALEALLEGHDKTFTLLCKLFLDCNPGGILAADSSGYSCFDRIVFNCIREMANAKAIFPEEAYNTDIEGIVPLNWTPIPLSKTKHIAPFYRDSLEKISVKLLDRKNSPIFGKAGQPDGEHHIGLNSLYLALASCSFGLLRALVQLRPASVCDIDSRGGTILMAAFLRGSQQSIDLILETLEKQKDTTVINSVTNIKHSVLTSAIFNGRVDHAKQFNSLLRFPGFDLRLAFHQDEKGNCPLMSLAILTSRHTVLPLGQLKEDQKRGTPTTCEKMYENCWNLFKAISESVDPKELSDLYLRLSEGLFNRAGMRFLDALCSLPRPGCLELFLQSCPALRSQLHTPDAKGITPLMYASTAWRHHETIMFLLKTSEVDVGHRDEQGHTALFYVAQNLGQFSDGGVASKLIQEYGQDPLAVDNHGQSPLRHAVANGNVWEGSPYHRLLRDPDAPMDWTDEKGSNPLHLAVKGGSPLAIKLLLQHSSSSSWLNAVDADGLVPLAHFFSDFRNSKYMSHYRLRFPYSGPVRMILSLEDSLQYHHEATEATRMMLNRPDILPDIPDKEGRTPLWHALDSMRKEHAAFSQRPEIQDSGRFDGFLRETIETLCARDDVNPHQSTGTTKTPLELATELIEAGKQGKRQGSVVNVDSSPGGVDSSLPGHVDSSPTGDANADGRAKLRIMIKALKPMIQQPGTLNKLVPPHLRRPTHLRRPPSKGQRTKQPAHLRSSVNMM